MNEIDHQHQQDAIITEMFKKQLIDILDQLQTSWKPALIHAWDTNVAGQIQILLYKLAGSSAMLGYTNIAAISKTLSHKIVILIEKQELSTEEKNELESLFIELEEFIKTDKPTSMSDLDSQILAIQSLREIRTNRLIFLVEKDPIEAQALASQLGYFGYTTYNFASIQEMQTALSINVPQAMIMDIYFPNAMAEIFEDAVADKGKKFVHPPIIYISNSDLLTSRLQAVRAGGVAYFSKPVDIGALIDTLDRLLIHETKENYRILIIDDTLVQAKFFSLILNKQGMDTRIVTNSLEVMEPLHEFNPDLILLDMYMPDCSGMELASVIRQMENFVSIPIVYLSAETDKDRQLEAMKLGGDDFLAKPIKPEHLIASVTSRIERYRKLRSLMARDGLTGLYNHSTTKDRLTQEIICSNRQNTQLSFAMLDLDHFKNINDSHGHSVGDRVLKSLSRFLQQRLRKSDIIGRFGGEEFAVILTNTSETIAFNLLDNLRENFSKIRHLGNDKEFFVAFSCGISSYPKFSSTSSIIEAADKTLYKAKHQGRNLVILDNS